MALEVGDKVVVWNAGTSWAFAKKVEPVAVGDKVDILTLSDGTKLSMPRIELDLSDYVWVIPEWETPFNLGDLPFSWSTIPLGAAVFTVTDIFDCWRVGDSQREWETGSLSGYYFICITGEIGHARLPLYVVANGETDYMLGIIGEDRILNYDEFNVMPGTSVGTGLLNVGQTIERAFGYGVLWAMYYIQVKSKTAITVSGAGKLRFYWRILYGQEPMWIATNKMAIIIPNLGYYIDLKTYMVPAVAGDIFSVEELITHGYTADQKVGVNPDYPGLTVTELDVPIYMSGYFEVNFNGIHSGTLHQFSMSPMYFLNDECITEHMKVGDKYVIYNPATQKLLFNDAVKTILASAYWRAITAPGEEISTTPVQYAWDGAGQVYLSQSKTTLSSIFYDNELQVSNLAAGSTKTLPYHSSDPFVTSGETVSRELVNITSILRAGANEITLTVRDTAGTKIGFPTPVYIIRSMT